VGWIRRTAACIGPIGIGLAFGACGVLGCAANLRPASLPLLPDATQSSAGVAQIAAVGRTHGLERWQRFSRARFQLDDADVAACLRGGIVPLGAARQRFEISVTLRDVTARARFVDGPRAGETVGIKGDLAYRVNDDGSLEYATDACVQDYLRVLQRSFLLPLSVAARVESGEASAFPAGERTLDGRSYDVLFVTVPTGYEASGEDEHYLLWKDRASGRVEWIELTDRRRSRRARDVLHYTEYRDVEGVQVAGRIERVDEVGSSSANARLELSEIDLD
jgi:hypothetical protein